MEEEEPTVPPVQTVNSFFASLPDEDSDYLSEDEMENGLYFKFDWRYGTLKSAGVEIR